MNKFLPILFSLVLIFWESHGSINSTNKKNKINCIDVLSKGCNFNTSPELTKIQKYGKLIETLDINNVGENNNKPNKLFENDAKIALEGLTNYFRSCKDNGEKTEKKQKEDLKKYMKKNRLTLLALATSSKFKKMEIKMRIANLFRLTGFLPITIYYKKNEMGKKIVTSVYYASQISHQLSGIDMYFKLGGNETRSENIKRIAEDYGQIIINMVNSPKYENSSYEKIPYVNASGTLKITNLKLLIKNLAKDADIIMPKNTDIMIEKLFIEQFNEFTEIYSNSIEDLIDLHDFFLLMIVKELNLLPIKLFKGDSQPNSNDIQKKCLEYLISFNDRILYPLILLRINNRTINEIYTFAKDMTNSNQLLKNVPFIFTSAELVHYFDSLRQFSEVIYKLEPNHNKNIVTLSKWNKYEEKSDAMPNMKIDFLLNHIDSAMSD
ncbi:unnamed protein product [Gordionus sp. m RMFG-2023]